MRSLSLDCKNRFYDVGDRYPYQPIPLFGGAATSVNLKLDLSGPLSHWGCWIEVSRSRYRLCTGQWEPIAASTKQTRFTLLQYSNGWYQLKVRAVIIMLLSCFVCYFFLCSNIIIVYFSFLKTFLFRRLHDLFAAARLSRVFCNIYLRWCVRVRKCHSVCVPIQHFKLFLCKLAS